MMTKTSYLEVDGQIEEQRPKGHTHEQVNAEQCSDITIPPEVCGNNGLLGMVRLNVKKRDSKRHSQRVHGNYQWSRCKIQIIRELTHHHHAQTLENASIRTYEFQAKTFPPKLVGSNRHVVVIAINSVPSQSTHASFSQMSPVGLGSLSSTARVGTVIIAKPTWM